MDGNGRAHIGVVAYVLAITGMALWVADLAAAEASVGSAAGQQASVSGDLDVNGQDDAGSSSGYAPVIFYDVDGNPLDPCQRFDALNDSWLDRSQAGLYRTVCGSAAWFDGFFGNSRFDEQTGNTYGRISLGGFYDDRDHFDGRMHFAANFAFPALRHRGSFFVGQGNSEALLEERGSTEGQGNIDAISSSGDNSLFLGFGLDRTKGLERGLSLRAGVKIGSPIEPFIKARYRYAWQVAPKTLLRLLPVVYWRSREGFGATLGSDIDNYISDNLLLRWTNFANVSQDNQVEGVAWGSTLTLFQALANSRALTYSAFLRGETLADVKRQNYGFETKFRHRFLRKWLFLEYVASVSWPREMLSEQRKFNPGAGIRFEAFFGPTPDAQVR